MALRRLTSVGLSMLLTAAVIAPAAAVTKSQVDAACADSRQAHEAYTAAQTDFEAAARALDEASARLENAENKADRIEQLYQTKRTEHSRLRVTANNQAADLYMQTLAGNSSLFFLSNPSQALTMIEFLNRGSEESVGAIKDLAAAAAELDRLGAELETILNDLTELRNARQTIADNQEGAMNRALEAYSQLSQECKDLQAEYQAEQARKAAEEEARRRQSQDSQTGGNNTTTVGGIICPFTPGRTQFIDSWGFPRSGGRRHQGTDMFAPYNEPVYAVANGTVTVANGGLGGKTIWLSTGTTAFYYAHLNDWAVSSGERVQQGQLIAYNGNSGNAAGTSPHVHFQIHPTGRGGAPINPYPTVASVCF